MPTSLQKPLSERLLASRLVDAVQLAAARAAVGEDDRSLLQYFVDNGMLTPFQKRQLRAGITRFHVGNYVVVDYLGRGGGGVILKARHTLLSKRYVALKTLQKNDLHSHNDAVERLHREIDILSLLDHPNIVRAYDVLQTRTQIYLVLEYIDGQDLGRVVRERGPLPVHEAVGYAVQAAQGLAYAHHASIVHRDVKPANLLLAQNGVVKLLDLGLAKIVAQEIDNNLSAKGLCLGTPEYMAPEQVEDYSQADARSDLFSLGATLFHLLTAELPVKGTSYLHKLKKILIEPPRPLLDARPNLPQGLAVIVDRLRSRSPAERPASAEETIALLQPFLKKPVADEPRCWSGKRRVAFVLELLQGRIGVKEASEQYGLAGDELERWQQRFFEGAEQALESGNGSAQSVTEQLHHLHAKIGSQTMEIDVLKDRLAALTTQA